MTAPTFPVFSDDATFQAKLERAEFARLRGAMLGDPFGPDVYCSDNGAPCDHCGSTCVRYQVIEGDPWGAYPALRLTIQADCACCRATGTFRVHCPKPLKLTAAMLSACDRNLHGVADLAVAS